MRAKHGIWLIAAAVVVAITFWLVVAADATDPDPSPAGPVPLEVPGTNCVALAVTDSQTIYCFKGRMLKVSTDAGATFNNVWLSPNSALTMTATANGGLLIGGQAQPADWHTPLYLLDPDGVTVTKVLEPRNGTYDDRIGNWVSLALDESTGLLAAGEGAIPRNTASRGPGVWVSSDNGISWNLEKVFNPPHEDGPLNIGYRHLHAMCWHQGSLYANTGDSSQGQGYRETWVRDPAGVWSLASKVEGHTACVSGSPGGFDSHIYFGSDVHPYGIYEYHPERPELAERLLLNLDGSSIEGYIANLWWSTQGVLFALTNGPQFTGQLSPVAVLASPDGGWTWHQIARDTDVDNTRYGHRSYQVVPLDGWGWLAKIGFGPHNAWAIPDLDPTGARTYPPIANYHAPVFLRSD